ncbi:5'-3' exonuclease, putative [Eimeria praecox]|uniref:5'-3' exonuclease, putative n=1 Tax=Eimeria praecox TaxID=51316 RepID=U6GRG3_9EIME|nr:5'-3' exonuclease, putative [Eimeria praecox]
MLSSASQVPELVIDMTAMGWNAFLCRRNTYRLCYRFAGVGAVELTGHEALGDFDRGKVGGVGIAGGMLHANEDLMWQSVFAALDLVVSTISPRKLLYLAADGVAPRAKMNQQRSRRYRAAKSAQEAAEAQEKQRQAAGNVFQVAPEGTEGQDSGVPNQTGGTTGKGFDSNCISPGTEFMASFFRHLRFYCEKKFQEDARWRGLKVLLSGPDVPGEGEHKIMAYLRCCKAADSSDPNTRHCLYGLDADLIMLSLASHEPQFALLREEVVFGRPTTVDAADRMLSEPEKLQLLHISLVREYLALDLLPAKIGYSQEQIAFRNQESQQISPESSGKLNEPNEEGPQSPSEGCLNRRVDNMLCFPSEKERVIDDFVIFCFLAGNDFLPHTFSTDIGEKGLDSLILCYGRFLAEYRVLAEPVASKTPADGPWLVGRCGQLNLFNLYIFLKLFVETVEDYKVAGKASDLQWLMGKKQMETKMFHHFEGDKAYRAKFYKDKLSIALYTEMGQKELQDLCRSYLEGLQWVSYYYFRGPDASGWRWYYPYHYAPFLRDVLECSVFKPSFSDTPGTGFRGTNAIRGCNDLSYLIDRIIPLPSGEPYSPFMQLLSILPPQSAGLLPPQLGHLLTNPPQELAPFFPKDFKIDMEGVKARVLSAVLVACLLIPLTRDVLQVPWGGVTLLPFVDEAVLERTVFPLLEKLPPEVLKRNETGKVVLLMREQNEGSSRQHGLFLGDKDLGICEPAQLASLDPVYGCEWLFFKNKIIHRRLGVLLDIPSLLNRINNSVQDGVSEGREQRHTRIFPSSLPWAFPDVVDSGVIEEEVLVLPPLLAARLETSKIMGVLRILEPAVLFPSPPSQINIKAAVVACVTTLRLALQRRDLSSMRRQIDLPVKMQPLPKLHPMGDELLFPTAPLPGASPAAAVLTPSLYSKCITWHRGTGVKVFKRMSTNQSVMLSVMPFSREELLRGSARDIVSLVKPTETLNKLLSSRFVLYDYPFVKLASPVAVWHPTFYLPVDSGSKAQSSVVPTDSVEQLREVEMEKRRLSSLGISVPDETEAFYFFLQHKAKARTGQSVERAGNTAPYWDQCQQVLGDPKESSQLEYAQVQPLEQQLQRLALDVTSALAGTEQRRSSAYHPDAALSTLLVELRPVEDVVMEEKLVGLQSTNRSIGNAVCSNSHERKSQACVHFRYGSETVFRLLPLLATPSNSLLESLQRCHQEVIDAVEANRKIQWKAGDDVFCIAPYGEQHLRPGATGVLENSPDSEDPHLSCKTVLVLQERAYTLEEAAELMRVTPFAAFQVFSSVFLKEKDNIYDCGLHIAIFTRETRKPAYVIRFSLPWPKRGSPGLQPSICRTHLFTGHAVELGKQLIKAFPAFGKALDSVGGRSTSLMTSQHLEASTVFKGLPDPAFLASRLASMAAQSPSRRAKAVTTEYAWLPDSVYKQFDAEREKWTMKLPPPCSTVLRAYKASCVPAADLLTIQKRIVSEFLRLREVQKVGNGEYKLVYAVIAHLGQRVAYARFRGSVRQGARGTACGFASKFGSCKIRCKYSSIAANSAKGGPVSNAGRRPEWGPLLFENGAACVDPVTINLKLKNGLDLTGLNLKRQGQKEEVNFLVEEDANSINFCIDSRISAAERVILFQKQLAFLEDLCIEVLLDEPCLGASDGNGRIESLRMLLCPASNWLPLSSWVMRPEQPEVQQQVVPQQHNATQQRSVRSEQDQLDAQASALSTWPMIQKGSYQCRDSKHGDRWAEDQRTRDLASRLYGILEASR